MFEAPQTPQTPNPLNPVMPAPGMSPGMPSTPPPPPSPSLPPQPQVHTMPERFRSTGSGPKGSDGSKRLVIILLVILGVGGLVVGGLWAMNTFLLNESNTNNTNNTNAGNVNDTNTSEAATRDAQRTADLASIRTALSALFAISTKYPATLDDVKNNTVNIVIPNTTDPQTTQPYSYQTCDSDTHYVLSATMELSGTMYVSDTVAIPQATAITCGLVNGNVNSNANANTNLNTNSSTNANANTNSNVGSPLPSSKDTDADGLTDVEEAAFGTDASNPDSDSDTFIDGKQIRSDNTIVGEVYLGYNPKGEGTLEAATSLVRRVENSTKVYSVLVPTKWTATADAQGGVLVTPDTQTGEFFQVQAATNASRLTPQQWYQQNNPAANVASLGTIAVNGLEGIISEDSSTVYLFKDTSAYSIQYGTGSVTQANFRTIFDVIVRNFKLVASS